MTKQYGFDFDNVTYSIARINELVDDLCNDLGADTENIIIPANGYPSYKHQLLLQLRELAHYVDNMQDIIYDIEEDSNGPDVVTVAENVLRNPRGLYEPQVITDKDGNVIAKAVPILREDIPPAFPGDADYIPDENTD